MDQNTETPAASEQPPASSEWAPEPTTPPASEVIDIQPGPAVEETPLQPEIIDSTFEASPPKKNSNGWVIALIVLIVLCCCCLLFFVPILFLGKFLASLLGNIYYLVVDILNSIFGGVIQFYP